MIVSNVSVNGQEQGAKGSPSLADIVESEQAIDVALTAIYHLETPKDEQEIDC